MDYDDKDFEIVCEWLPRCTAVKVLDLFFNPRLTALSADRLAGILGQRSTMSREHTVLPELMRLWADSSFIEASAALTKICKERGIKLVATQEWEAAVREGEVTRVLG